MLERQIYTDTFIYASLHFELAYFNIDRGVSGEGNYTEASPNLPISVSGERNTLQLGM